MQNTLGPHNLGAKASLHEAMRRRGAAPVKKTSDEDEAPKELRPRSKSSRRSSERRWCPEGIAGFFLLLALAAALVAACVNSVPSKKTQATVAKAKAAAAAHVETRMAAALVSTAETVDITAVTAVEATSESAALAVPGCVDDPSVSVQDCRAWAAAGECDVNPTYMLATCAFSCGCRAPPAPLVPACYDKDTTGACATWAAAGECEANPAYMKLRCAASCGSCDMLDYSKRCPMPCARAAPNRTSTLGSSTSTRATTRATRTA